MHEIPRSRAIPAGCRSQKWLNSTRENRLVTRPMVRKNEVMIIAVLTKPKRQNRLIFQRGLLRVAQGDNGVPNSSLRGPCSG